MYQPNYKRMLAAVLICLLMLPLAVLAQFKVTGKVTDKKTNTVVPGVVVREKGTKQGTTAGADGTFSLDVKSGDATLLVNFMGYMQQTITVGGRSMINIELEEDVKALSDVVIIGYQDITRRKTTGAVASVKGKEIENTPYATFDAMLQGRVPGLTVLTTTGEPGSSSIVNVRGSTSVNPGGVSAPLYVIDGVIFDVSDVQATYGFSNPLSAINPNDIESVDVLKDASASAIYGARAANGVIIIKTKRPKNGAPQIRVGSYMGIADKPAMKPMVVGADERRMKMDLLQKYGDYLRNQQLDMMLTDSLNPAYNNNTDWQGLFLKRATINNVDASVGAASDVFAYRLAYGYYKEDGVMKGYDFIRSSPRLFLSVKPTKQLEISNDLFITFTKARHGRGDGGRYPFSTWGFPASFWKVGDAEKKIFTGDFEDMLDDDRTTSVMGNTRLLYTFVPGLVWNSNVAYNFSTARRDYFRPAIMNWGINSAENNVNQMRRYEVENYLMYNKTLAEDHSISALVGQGVEKQVLNNTYLYGAGIIADAVKTVTGVPSGPDLNGNSGIQARTRLSYFARVGYDYKGKYLLQLNYRRDGSSRFSKNDRWGEFPSASVGWVVSDEAFFSSVFRNAVSFLKFRGSYGVTGSDPLDYYAQYQGLVSDASYGGSNVNGSGGGAMYTYNGTNVMYPDYANTSAANGITWERSPQFNLGMDLNLLKDRIQVTADIYRRESNAKVFDVPVTTTTGYTRVRNNYVDVLNQGVELAINSTNFSTKSGFIWRTNFNIAINENMVARLPQGGRDFKFGDPWLQRSLTVGQPLFQINVWKVDGIYQTDAEVPVDPLTGRPLRAENGNPFRAGDPIRRDLNGDYIVDLLDKENAGNPNPKISGGLTNSFSYKGFSLDVLCTFFAGRKLWNGYLSDKLQDAGSADPYNRWGGYSAVASDFGDDFSFWSGPGSTGNLPGLITNSVEKWHISQSIFVEDASFFRLKNIRLGYSLPERWVKPTKLKGIRFYGLLDNVFTITSATVPDPEAVGYDGYSSGNDYPIPKKWTLGLDINF